MDKWIKPLWISGRRKKRFLGLKNKQKIVKTYRSRAQDVAGGATVNISNIVAARSGTGVVNGGH